MHVLEISDCGEGGLMIEIVTEAEPFRTACRGIKLENKFLYRANFAEKPYELLFCHVIRDVGNKDRPRGLQCPSFLVRRLYSLSIHHDGSYLCYSTVSKVSRLLLH